MKLSCKKSRRHLCQQRSGISMAELVASAAVLTLLMSMVTGMCYRISTIWKDVGHHRVALVELSNQLDRLTTMEVEQAREELESIAATSTCSRTLRDPKLKGELVETDLGTQVNLELNWTRVNPGTPVRFSGWIVKEAGDDE